jgi:hypothetical protein
MRRFERTAMAGLLCLGLGIGACAGGGGNVVTTNGGAGGSAGSGGGGGGTTDAGPPADALQAPDALQGNKLQDFPAAPVIANSMTAPVPANAPDLFPTTGKGTPPCIVEPVSGALLPQNWLRPRFEYKPANGENLFEIAVTVARFATPLRIYTTDLSYAMDATLWNSLRISVVNEPITVSIRGLTLAAAGATQAPPTVAAQSTFTVAPVSAPGKIVYWSQPTSDLSSDGVLKGFGIGEEGVETVLTGPDVQMRNTTNDSCIGCHSATPDGLSVGFSFGPPSSLISSLDTYFNNVVDIQDATKGGVPSYVSAAGLSVVRGLRGIPAYSKGHWADGDRIVLLSDPTDQGTLLWVQLDNGDMGTVARMGDTNGATEPTFSHDGNTVVYVSAPSTSIKDGRLDVGPADLYSVPYMNRAGGPAAPIPGASSSQTLEYYPAFSPDDKMLAYTATTVSGTSTSAYSNPRAQVFVIPAAGGQTVRLVANDGSACDDELSPGLTNDWPKWSPEATEGPDGKTYYWLTFSSKRRGRPPGAMASSAPPSQIFITAVTTSSGAGGGLQTYPALYLWNQPPLESNHTPSWDNYDIPPVIVP